MALPCPSQNGTVFSASSETGCKRVALLGSFSGELRCLLGLPFTQTPPFSRMRHSTSLDVCGWCGMMQLWMTACCPDLFIESRQAKPRVIRPGLEDDLVIVGRWLCCYFFHGMISRRGCYPHRCLFKIPSAAPHTNAPSPYGAAHCSKRRESSPRPFKPEPGCKQNRAREEACV